MKIASKKLGFQKKKDLLSPGKPRIIYGKFFGQIQVLSLLLKYSKLLRPSLQPFLLVYFLRTESY